MVMAALRSTRTLIKFRIEVQPGITAQPTPGMHRDSVDWVLALLCTRDNVERGETAVADVEGQSIYSHTYRNITPIHSLDPARPA